MQIYEVKNRDDRYTEVKETYSYQGSEVVIITVFKTGINSIAIVEDINTGEQYEVFRDLLY